MLQYLTNPWVLGGGVALGALMLLGKRGGGSSEQPAYDADQANADRLVAYNTAALSANTELALRASDNQAAMFSDDMATKGQLAAMLINQRDSRQIAENREAVSRSGQIGAAIVAGSMAALESSRGFQVAATARLGTPIPYPETPDVIGESVRIHPKWEKELNVKKTLGIKKLNVQKTLGQGKIRNQRKLGQTALRNQRILGLAGIDSENNKTNKLYLLNKQAMADLMQQWTDKLGFREHKFNVGIKADFLKWTSKNPQRKKETKKQYRQRANNAGFSNGQFDRWYDGNEVSNGAGP